MKTIIYNADIANEGRLTRGYIVIDDEIIAEVGEGEPAAAVMAECDVRNDVDGIGDPRFDNSRFFGSQGRLQGYIDMAALSRYHLQSSDPRFEEAMRVLSHELLHRWAARVRSTNSTARCCSWRRTPRRT